MSALPEPERAVSSRLVTAFDEQLRRRIALLVACLLLALAPAPAFDVIAPDTSFVSHAAPPAALPRSTAATVRTCERLAATPRQARLATARRSAAIGARAAPRSDRRYLYLELLTLLS